MSQAGERWKHVAERLPFLSCAHPHLASPSSFPLSAAVKKKVAGILQQPLGSESLLLYKKMMRQWAQEEVERVVLEELKLLGQRYVAGETKYALEITMARQRGIKPKAAGDQSTASKHAQSRL